MIIGLHSLRSIMFSSDPDVSCHDQCEMTRGCWGTLADECVQCRSYNYQGTCVEACDE